MPPPSAARSSIGRTGRPPTVVRHGSGESSQASNDAGMVSRLSSDVGGGRSAVDLVDAALAAEQADQDQRQPQQGDQR